MSQLFTRREAAKRHYCTYQAIRKWEKYGWLTPAEENPFRYTAKALDAAAAKAEDARSNRFQKFLAARPAVPAPADGQGNALDAAGWAGVSYSTIYAAQRTGELKAVSIAPLRFDRDVVKRWSEQQFKQDGDLRIVEIPARLPGRPGKTYVGRKSAKLSRIIYVIKRLGIETYHRRAPEKRGRNQKFLCIREERFPEVEAAYLAIEAAEHASPLPAPEKSEPPKPAETVETSAGEPQADRSAYVGASTLWGDRFATYRKFETWLKNTPETEVRRRRPRKNRLELHAADWARYWDAFDKGKFDAADR